MAAIIRRHRGALRAGVAALGWAGLAVALGGLSVAGCDSSSSGGGGGGGTAALSTPVTGEEDAARFLTQATFGPTLPEIERLSDGDFDAWLREQRNQPQSNHALVALGTLAGGQEVSSSARQKAWLQIATRGNDQFRQRVAFALSQIFVVSDVGGLGSSSWGTTLADYNDMLARQAFGTYRELLEAVTLHPAMSSSR